MYGIELLPTGYYRLFNKSAYPLQSEHASLIDSLGKYKSLFKDLYTLSSVDSQISYFEKGLLKLKIEASCTEELVNKIDEIISYVVKDLASVNVNDILQRFVYSHTSLERDFKKVVGSTPKEFIQTYIQENNIKIYSQN